MAGLCGRLGFTAASKASCIRGLPQWAYMLFLTSKGRTFHDVENISHDMLTIHTKTLTSVIFTHVTGQAAASACPYAAAS